VHEVGAEPLSEYADDRPACWKAMQASFEASYPVIPPKVCKKLFDGMLNGGNYRNLLRSNKLRVENNAYLKRFQDSVREAAKQLLALALDVSHDTPQAWTLIASYATQRAKELESRVDAASLFMHFIYEHYERKVLTAMVAYCKSIGRKVTALIHDGLHMRLKFGETSIDKKLLREMEKFVLPGSCWRRPTSASRSSKSR
jgi:hypothetical protein